MKAKTAVGIYENVGAAERARNELVAAGVARERISLSRSLTEDGIAAEAPGQSFENQQGGGQPESEREHARFNETLRAGGCIVTVNCADGADESGVRELMQRSGARGTLARPE